MGGWILPAVLIGLFSMLAIGHAYCVARYLAKRVPYSVVPLLGGVLGTAGFYLAPETAIQTLWWLPPLLDFGSIPSVVYWTFRAVKPKA